MKHLAIIADGNRRWAKKNNLPQEFGYVQALNQIEQLSLSAIEEGIPFLSFFCLSTENFRRTEHEIEMFFRLAREYFKEKVDWYLKQGIRIKFRGGQERFPKDIQNLISEIEEKTGGGERLTLFIMADYGGKWDIV